MLLEPNASPGDRYERKYEDKENYMAAGLLVHAK